MRRLYSVLIQLHPRAFREQFGPEMMAIFDQASRSHLPLIGDAVASLFRQWMFRPQPRAEDLPAQTTGAPAFLSLEPYRMRSAALVHGGILSVTLIFAVIFLIDHPGKKPQWLIGMHRAVEGLFPVSRASLEKVEPDTVVRLPEQTKDIWKAAAIAYFGHMPLMKALDTNGDYMISGRELILAPASLRRLDHDNDGKLQPWECGFFGTGEPGAFIRRNPVLAAIDAGRNGEISASEIRNATESLQTLDRNGDRYLTPDEFLP